MNGHAELEDAASPGPKPKPALEEIRRALALICMPGEVYELRAPNTTKATVSGYFDDLDEFAKFAGWANQSGLEAPGVYVTLNPAKHDLLARSANSALTFAKHTTADADIVKRRWLLIDLDSVRPSGISATDSEHVAALDRARKAREYLVARGWAEPISADSGNGAHLLCPIDLPNDTASTALVKRVLESLALTFDDDAVCVDRSCFNAARIMKIPGTVARKGSSILQRPHRISRVIEAGGGGIVSREQLEELAALIPAAPPRPESRNRTDSVPLAEWITAHGIRVKSEAPWNGGRRFILEACLFDSSHGGSSAALIELASGARVYRCLHNGCADKKWADARTLFGETNAEAQVVDPDVERLAKLSPLEYDKQRKAEAKRLGVRVDTLDDEVGKTRPKAPATTIEALAPAAPEPWAETVDGKALLNDLREFTGRFIVVSPSSLIALVLWIVFTYLLDIAETSPRLALTSPVKRCGKTRLLGVLNALIYKAIPTSNVSPSAIFRTIDQERCSLLIDEADAIPRRGSERGEEMRGLLNSGHTRESAFAIRNIKCGDDWIPKKFSTWAAIAVAGIGKLPDTWADRSIAIAMQRKSPRQQVERLIRRNVGARAAAAELTRKIARWVADHRDELALAIPDLPKELDDRASDNWEPLFAIADLSGGDWPSLARQAAAMLSTGREEGSSVGEELLSDIKEIFVGRDVESDEDSGKKISSSDLCAALVGIESRPWAEFGRSGKPLTPPRLARLLADFGIAPATIRIGTRTPKGYTLKAFESAFSCYLSANPLSKRNTATTLGAVEESSDFQSTTETECCGIEIGTFPNGENDCGVVADRNGIKADREDF